MKWKITPKILIVSVLHVSGNQAIPIKGLIKLGELFGFTSNSIRVTTTRLLRDGRLESDERGFYRLRNTDTPMSRFVNRWKTEESQVKDWDGSWLCILLPSRIAGNNKKKLKALLLLGFREGAANLWVRPNNISMDQQGVKELLVYNGMDDAMELFVGTNFRPLLEDRWKIDLWPVKKLMRDYEDIQARVDESMARLKSLPTKNALFESYLVGTEVIHVLVTDPLLPEDMMPSVHRVILAKSMHIYNDMGKKVWLDTFKDFQIPPSPHHQGLEGIDISAIIRQNKS